MTSDQDRTPMILSGMERRTEERLPARFEVHFQGKNEAFKAFRAYSVNMSLGGLCIKTTRAYEKGEPLELFLQIEGVEHHLRGVVAWARGGAIGVRFDGSAEEDREEIRQLFESLRT